MKNLKLTIFAIVLMGAVTMAFAMTKEDAKEVPTKAVETTYFVIGKSSTHYTVTTNPAQALPCGGSQVEPCRISSSAPVSGGQMLISDVEDEELTEIEAWRPSLP